MATSKNQEVEQLKQQLNEKVGEFRDIYNKVLEKGGEELPDDILNAVTGGIMLYASQGSWSPNASSEWTDNSNR